MWIGFVVLCVAAGDGGSGHAATERSPSVVANQVGFARTGPKAALLLNFTPAKAPPALLMEAASGAAVGRFETKYLGKDRDSGDIVHRVDFSAYRRPGRYYVRVGKYTSQPFVISKRPLSKVFRLLLRSYYLQRCGVELRDEVTGIRHAACHLEDGTIARSDGVEKKGGAFRSSGGWHDAGDYGKYMATTAISVARLLELFERVPALFFDGHLDIPESDNGVPDVLDEVRVAVDWMLTMQRSDGAAYRKIGGAKWPPLVSPEEDAQERFVYGVSTPETAKFAAALAIAARVYKAYDAVYAKKCLAAAERAWSYLERHPEMEVDWAKEDDGGSGKYLYSTIDSEEALKHDVDDRVWAAAELFAASRVSKYRAYLMGSLTRLSYTLFEWKDPAPMAFVRAVFRLENDLPRKLVRKLRTEILRRAKAAYLRTRKSGYQLANERFIWGSNKMVAEEGITLMVAYRLTGERRYVEAAWEQLNFLLGKNHFGISFVTGVGAHSVENLHHIFGRSKKLHLPGFLVGGPNNLAQAGHAPKNRRHLSYIDDARSYATNEYAIDYNASLIGLIGLLAADYRDGAAVCRPPAES